MTNNAAAARLLLIDAISELHNSALGSSNIRAHELLSEAISYAEVGDNVRAIYNIERAALANPHPVARRLMRSAANKLSR